MSLAISPTAADPDVRPNGAGRTFAQSRTVQLRA
jgi:hypothetical protein